MVVALWSDSVEGRRLVADRSIGFLGFVFVWFCPPVQKHPFCAEGVSWQLVLVNPFLFDECS